MAVLSDKDKQYFLSLKPKDISAKFIIDSFADKGKKENGKFVNVPSKYKTYDTFVLEKGEYTNTEKVTTNVGLFIVNKFLFEKDFSKVLGYINTPITGKVLSGIDDKLSNALLNDKITVEQMVSYLKRLQWLSMQFNSVFSNSFTMKTLKPVPSVMKMKDKMMKENEEAIKSGDVVTGVKIETELKDAAKKELAGDPGMDLYDSGARGSFDNNYKNIALMKGPVYNPTNQQWDIVGSNFMNGINKEDIPSYGNAVVAGQYPKSVGTQVSGYFTKQLNAAFQGVILDVPDSDCGTKGYVEIIITPWVKKDVMYNYIVEGTKLVLLDDTNIDKYINKKVKMRSPMFCIGDKLCRKCAGVMFDKLGIENVGLTTAKVSSTLLNLSMKKFHNSTASVTTIDLNNITL